jgi:hypothetical protein
MSETRPLSRRIVRTILLSLLAVVLIFVFYFAVVMGQPQTDRQAPDASTLSDQPLPAPLASPVTLQSDTALNALADAFPAPVMYAAGSGLTFTSGACADVPFQDGVARVVTLVYRTEDFYTLTVESIYPARALSLLLEDGRSFTDVTTDTMAGMPYIGRKDAATLRMIAQGSEALYVFTTPLASDGAIDQWTNALQLHRPEAAE